MRERELVRTFCARRVDGLIVVPAGDDHSYLRPELDAGTPAVFVDRPPGPEIDVDTVLADNAGGAVLAVEHLRASGHRRVAFFGDSPAIFTAAERLRGYRAALGGRFDPRLVAMRGPELTGLRADLDRMLALDDPPTAVFTGNGRLTVTTLRVLDGRRLALVGFDDFELADLLTPG